MTSDSSGPEPLHDATVTPPRQRGAPPERDTAVRRAGADIVAAAGAVLLLFSAFFQLLQGISALSADDILTSGSYAYRFNTTAWGWMQVILAVLIALAAVGILMRRTWGQLTGLVLIGLSMVMNFAFIPYFPLWAITALAVNALVVWALLVQLGEPRDAETPVRGDSESGPPAPADAAERSADTAEKLRGTS